MRRLLRMSRQHQPRKVRDMGKSKSRRIGGYFESDLDRLDREIAAHTSRMVQGYSGILNDPSMMRAHLSAGSDVAGDASSSVREIGVPKRDMSVPLPPASKNVDVPSPPEVQAPAKFKFSNMLIFKKRPSADVIPSPIPPAPAVVSAPIVPVPVSSKKVVPGLKSVDASVPVAPPVSIAPSVPAQVPAATQVSSVPISDTIPEKTAFLWWYFIIYALGLGVLYYLGGTWQTLVAALVFSIILELACSNHSPRLHHIHSFTFLGLMILVLYAGVIYFNDVMSILLAAVYALSFVVAAALYFYHRDKEFAEDLHKSFPRTFAVVFYSHVIALSVALALAWLLPQVLVGDSFVTVAFLLCAWVLPCVFAYFFLTKFLYLRFFDPVHVLRDLWRAFIKGFCYSILLLLVFGGAYLLTAMQLTMFETAGHQSSVESAIGKAGKVMFELSEPDISADLRDSEVSREVQVFSSSLIDELKSKKDVVGSRYFTVEDYISDAYFGKLLSDLFLVSYLNSYSDDAVSVKDDLFREYSRLEAEKLAGFADGSSDSSAHLTVLKDYVLSHYEPYSQSAELSALEQDAAAMAGSYAGLVESSGIATLATDASGDMMLFDADSRLGASVYSVLRHTVLFRDVLLFTLRNDIFVAREISNPSVVDELYYDWDVQESETSKIIRFRILKSEYDAWRAAYS